MELQAPGDTARLGEAGLWYLAGSARGRPRQWLADAPAHQQLRRFAFNGRKSARPCQSCQPKRAVVLQREEAVHASTERQPAPACAYGRAAAQGSRGRHLPLARPSPPGARAPHRAGDRQSLPTAGHWALASCPAQTLSCKMLSLAGFFGTEACRVLCVHTVLGPSGIFWCKAVPPSSRWSRLLHRCSCLSCPHTSPASAAPQCSMSHLILARL